MKRIVLTLVVALTLGAASAWAQAASDKLQGIWQQQEKVEKKGEKPRTLHLPVWKVLGADGSFTTFLIASSDGTAIITNAGRYAVTSDSAYEERIERSIIFPQLVGGTNTLRYRFVTDDLLEVTYTMPHAEEPATELWQRVTMKMPKQKKR